MRVRSAPNTAGSASSHKAAVLMLLGCLSCACLLSAIAVRAQEAEADADMEFVIVVNAANDTEVLDAKQTSHMFLKKIRQWEDGLEVAPVDLSSSSTVRNSFSIAIHGRSMASVKSYWQQMIFSGRDVPPPEKADDQEVLDFVAANPGAIGYISATTPVPVDEGVKVITTQASE